MTPVNEGEILAGKYRVERVLGVGGMGVVVAALHIALDERSVGALKKRMNQLSLSSTID